MSRLVDGTQRIDYEVAGGGEVYIVMLAGTSTDATLRLANLVRQTGSTVDVFGTGGADTMEFDATTGLYVSINGIGYDFAGGSVAAVTFDGGAGENVAELRGSAEAETAHLLPDHGTLSGPGLNVTVASTSHITVIGGGGNDVAFLYDSADNDHFYADPSESVLSGPGGVFELKTIDFPVTHAYAGAGHDTVEFHDSAGDDKLLFQNGMVKVSAQDGSYFREAKYFEEVVSISDNGSGAVGDVAYMHGSIFDDEFTASPGEAKMELNVRMVSGIRTVDTSVTAVGYDFVHGYSRYGGTDSATLNDGPGNDRLFAKPNFVVFKNDAADLGEDFFARAKGFDFVTVLSVAGGNDVADMYASPGRDIFTGTPEWSLMQGIDEPFVYNNRAEGFKEVYARGGDADIANLYDSDVYEDHLEANGALADSHWARVSNGVTSPLDYLYEIQGFGSAEVWAQNEEDNSDVDPSTIDWLVTHGWE